MRTARPSTSEMLEPMGSISPSSKQYQVMASPNFSGEQADSVSAGVEQWGLQDYQHQECFRISPHNILPAIGFYRPPLSNQHSHRRSFRWAIRLTSLHLREAIKSEPESEPMAFDMAKKEHGFTSTSTQEWQ